MAEVFSTIGERMGAYRVLVRKPEGKRPLGKYKRRREDNIKMDLQEWGGGKVWIDLTENKYSWGALLNAVMNIGVS